MVETEIYSDFIVVHDEGGGAGAAPLEFADYLGMPLRKVSTSCTMPYRHQCPPSHQSRRHQRLGYRA
jgi:hypothetical protein